MNINITIQSGEYGCSAGTNNQYFDSGYYLGRIENLENENLLLEDSLYKSNIKISGLLNEIDSINNTLIKNALITDKIVENIKTINTNISNINLNSNSNVYLSDGIPTFETAAPALCYDVNRPGVIYSLIGKSGEITSNWK